jgi:uncharacterized membrane protein (UPF0127 family)
MRFSPLTFIIVLAMIFIVSACGGDDENHAPPTATSSSLSTVTIKTDGGDLHAEVASTNEERSEGLSGRASMDDDAGMLFDFGQTRTATLFMRGMLFPLDMVWMTGDGRVVGIDAGVQPMPSVPEGDLPLYSPDVPVRYALELNAGTAARLGIDDGDVLSW